VASLAEAHEAMRHRREREEPEAQDQDAAAGNVADVVAESSVGEAAPYDPYRNSAPADSAVVAAETPTAGGKPALAR
jgi:hypothetical protein